MITFFVDIEILLALLGLVAMVVGFIAEQRRERLDMQEITNLRTEIALMARSIDILSERLSKLETTEDEPEETEQEQ